jgi:hypothetical protein
LGFNRPLLDPLAHHFLAGIPRGYDRLDHVAQVDDKFAVINALKRSNSQTNSPKF